MSRAIILSVSGVGINLFRGDHACVVYIDLYYTEAAVGFPNRFVIAGEYCMLIAMRAARPFSH